MPHIRLFFWLLFITWNIQHCTAQINAPKKAIIIGASAGMGREVAKRLSQKGYILGLAARRLPLLKSLQKELLSPSYIKQLDITDLNARETLQELIDEMGGLDLIVISTSPWLDIRISTANNPPNESAIDPTGYHHQQQWKEKLKTLKVCATDCIAMADVALEYFKRQNSGHLVGISSTAGLRGRAEMPEYAAAKACFSTYMEGIRNMMIQCNINVQVTDIIPGFVAIEHSPLGTDPTAYWEITCQQAGQEIIDAIQAQKKIAYIPAKCWIIAILLKYLPDYIFNKYLPWL